MMIIIMFKNGHGIRNGTSERLLNSFFYQYIISFQRLDRKKKETKYSNKFLYLKINNLSRIAPISPK